MSDPLMGIYGDILNDRRKAMSHPLPEGVHDNFTYGCIICGDTITVIESTRQPHECRVTETAKRYYANMPVRALLGIAPDFTGGLSVDEYMDEQRGRGQE